jgi:putative exosortase-associated protein (TIGR04073 family)
MKRMIVAVAGLAAVCALTLTTPAQAAEEQDNHISKLVRGWTNVATFWLEIPKQMYVVSMQRDAGAGVLFGPFKGLGFGVARLGAGLYEGLLFVLPKYEPIMDPPVVWPFEEAGTLASK